MLQCKELTLEQAQEHERQGHKIAYSHAYYKTLHKNKRGFYLVKHNQKITVKTTSLDNAVNEYNLID